MNRFFFQLRLYIYLKHVGCLQEGVTFLQDDISLCSHCADEIYHLKEGDN